MEIQISRESQP